MNYIVEINAFNDWCEQHYLPMEAQFLWYKLMAKNNRLGWCEWVQVDNLELMGILRIKREATVIGIRDKLIETGLIKFIKGKKGTPNKYKMISLSELKVKSVVETVVNTEVKSVVETVDLNKLNINETKQTNMSETSSDESANNEIKNVEIIDIDSYFEDTYAEYPKKEGKKDGKQAYIQYLTKGREFKGFPNIRLNHAEIRVAIQEYVKSKYGTDTQFFPMFSTFMNGGIVDYIDENNEHFRERYERVMARTYGEKWREIKFKYKGRGIDK